MKELHHLAQQTKESEMAIEKERQIRRAAVQQEEERLLSHNKERTAEIEKLILEKDEQLRLMNRQFEV